MSIPTINRLVELSFHFKQLGFNIQHSFKSPYLTFYLDDLFEEIKLSHRDETLTSINQKFIESPIETKELLKLFYSRISEIHKTLRTIENVNHNWEWESRPEQAETEEELLFQKADYSISQIIFKYSSSFPFLKSIYYPYLELSTNENIASPFRDKETENLFHYLESKWSYDKDIKHAYLWEYLFTENNGKLTNKTEFESYVRKKYNFNKKFNYDNASSPKNFDSITRLHNEFRKI